MAAKRPETIRAGFVAAMARPIAQLAANLPRIDGPASFDPIHDARVALRRIAVLLRAFEPYLPARRVTHLKRETRWLRRELGPARDLDVFIHETIPELRALFPHEAGLEMLLQTASAKRARLSRKLASAVASPRASRLMRSLQHASEPGTSPLRGRSRDGSGMPPKIDSPLADMVYAVLHRRWKKISGNHGLRKLDKAELHKLRIRLRNFRYICDGVAMMLPERRYTAMRRAMTALQDQLGTLNDAATAATLVAALAREAARMHDPAQVSRAAGVLAGWGAARREVLRAALDEPWRRMIKRGDRMFAALKH